MPRGDMIQQEEEVYGHVMVVNDGWWRILDGYWMMDECMIYEQDVHLRYDQLSTNR